MQSKKCWTKFRFINTLTLKILPVARELFKGIIILLRARRRTKVIYNIAFVNSES